MSGRKRHIRFDWAIKRILRDKANYGIMAAITDLTIEEVEQIIAGL
ncbi:MAG: hypothetical protein GVY26_04680 [Bacteroidetes bacterium]|jgi:hypothetical protein|nr:hypothetical protein [Bacteroidota bacterium]